MRAVVRVATVVLGLVLLVPAIADAKVKRSPTALTLALVETDPQSIAAQVSNPFKGCVPGRTVTLTEAGTGVAFHTTTTTRDGRFSIGLADVPFGASGFRVTVASKTIGSRLCEEATADVAFDEGTLSGGPNNGAFRGVLSSSVDACEPNRRILLYEISSGEPVFVGFNFTDASGAWTIAQAAGTYQAQADPVLLGGGNTFTYCRPFISPSWTYEDPPPE